MAYERDRGGAGQRGYTTRWDRAAKTFKARQPHCIGCLALGKTVKAELVDHVEPHKGDQSKFWNTANWQPSCRYHHDVVKQKLERLFEQGDVTLPDLWLNSAAAMALAKRHPQRQEIGADGWPIA